MLFIETDTLKFNAEACIDEIIDEKSLCTNNPNSQPMINNELRPVPVKGKANPSVNKSYEMVDNTLHESYFDTDGMDNADKFMDDYAKSYPKGLIIVKNEHEPGQHNISMPGRNHEIIVSSPDSPHSQKASPNSIYFETLQQAAKAAYNMVTNGQAILFQGVKINFDFLSLVL